MWPRPGERRVQLTVTGCARPVAHAPGLEVVHYGTTEDMHTILVDPAAAGVTMTDLPLHREWTTGDVVAGDVNTYMRERDGFWRPTRQGYPPLLDPDVSKLVDQGPSGLDVLRYQAGER